MRSSQATGRVGKWEGAGEAPAAAAGQVYVCVPPPSARTAHLLSSRTWARSLAGHMAHSVRNVLKLSVVRTRREAGYEDWALGTNG